MCSASPDGLPCIMTMVGGRPCPKGLDDCSQTVYQCMRCQVYEYGEPGDISHRECFEECQHGMSVLRK